ncbi:50S ribosomal protein L16 [Perkinsela sp. CCAP 1560/4]|nr:50S ribosomal protein L16 [Perkinsela sp. CCAP 1560/4]|eukprot:KNH05554.1 50S ribosomal protein L16 [Perkinsela sp. CCAP 1560/4]
MLQQCIIRRAWHYIHPKTGKPLRQPKSHGDPRYINNEAALIYGLWGLITTDFGCITVTQMEDARLAILQRMPTGGLFSLHMNADLEEFPVGFKPPESRMGKGKTGIHHYVFRVTTGIPLFEIRFNPDKESALHKSNKIYMHRAEAEVIFLKGRVCLPIETVVVPQGRVDEYNVFP